MNKIKTLSDLYQIISEHQCDDMEVRLDDFIKLLQNEEGIMLSSLTNDSQIVHTWISFTSKPDREPKFQFDENFASRYDWMKGKVLLDSGNYGENTQEFIIE